MRVRWLYFASIRERLGRDGDELELPSGATVGDAFAALQALHPELPAPGGGMRIARNQDFASLSDRVAPGDELALIPPVSGGCC